MTLIEMMKRNVKLYPQKTALIYKNLEISYEMLYEKSNTLSIFLLGIGLKKGERVGLLMHKTPEVIVSFLGVTTAGGVVLPIDYNQTISHIQSLLNLTDPCALIVSESFQPLLSRLKVPSFENNIIVIGQKAKKHYHSWNDIMAGNSHDLPGVDIQGDDTAYLNLTSGTTGVSKCAVATYDNIYWNTLSAVEGMELTHEDVHLCMFPVFAHPHELFARPLYLGGTIVLIDKISPKHIARAIKDNNVTCMMAIASIYETLVRLHEPSSFNLTSLRLPESGGMHVNPTLAKQFKERFKIPIVPVWGSTESAGIALATPVNGRYKQGSMGKACPYYEVKIIDEDGKELPPHEVGEMVINGPAICSKYFRSLEETKKYIKDGWFYTGDIVKKDSEGYFYFVGRKSGMMKVAGLKVSPIEIEDILSAHPKIAEVAVVKEQDRLHGEVPRAVIVLKQGEKIDKKDIRAYCEGRMSKYKVPRIIDFRTELPKTPGGKILWRKL